MATKIKLDQGIYLTPLNSESLLEIQDNLEARCFMCVHGYSKGFLWKYKDESFLKT